MGLPGLNGIAEKVGEALEGVKVICIDCVPNTDDVMFLSVKEFPGHVMESHPESDNAKAIENLVNSLGPLKGLVGVQ